MDTNHSNVVTYDVFCFDLTVVVVVVLFFFDLSTACKLPAEMPATESNLVLLMLCDDAGIDTIDTRVRIGIGSVPR